MRKEGCPFTVQRRFLCWPVLQRWQPHPSGPAYNASLGSCIQCFSKVLHTMFVWGPAYNVSVGSCIQRFAGVLHTKFSWGSAYNASLGFCIVIRCCTENMQGQQDSPQLLDQNDVPRVCSPQTECGVHHAAPRDLRHRFVCPLPEGEPRVDRSLLISKVCAAPSHG